MTRVGDYVVVGFFIVFGAIVVITCIATIVQAFKGVDPDMLDDLIDDDDDVYLDDELIEIGDGIYCRRGAIGDKIYAWFTNIDEFLAQISDEHIDIFLDSIPVDIIEEYPGLTFDQYFPGIGEVTAHTKDKFFRFILKDDEYEMVII